MLNTSDLRKLPTVVDLFCGCGAVTTGLNGLFQVLAAVDNDPVAAASYRANHPGVSFFEEDITKLDPNLLRRSIGNRNVDLMVVCAPCQPFSSQRHGNEEDDRIALILHTSRFASVLKPKQIFFENVKGLSAPKHMWIIEKLRGELKKHGYVNWLGPKSIDAADYHVPQRRHRCIMVAARTPDLLPDFPEPTSPADKRITVRKAIADLQSLPSGGSSRNDRLHFARRHQPVALRRFRYIKKNGGSRFDLPADLELKCHKGHSGHPDVYGRMTWDNVAPTLTTGCTDVTRGRFMHPQDDRAITLREAARLQTFPDNYIFEGSPQAIARQIGNAVPVQLARVIGQALNNTLIRSNRE